MFESILVILAYLIGSIPTSVWISKSIFKIDIRDYGSGNAGATNTFRVLGSKWGSIVMLADVTKGVIATSLYIVLPYYLTNELARTNFMIVLGLVAVIGHIFPIWADFKGGKKNKDLWTAYYELAKPFKIKFHWVKGHAENPYNNRCDELATQAADNGPWEIDEAFEAIV